MSKILTFARRSAVLASAGIVVAGGRAVYSARERENTIPTNNLYTFPKKKDESGQQVVVIGGEKNKFLNWIPLQLYVSAYCVYVKAESLELRRPTKWHWLATRSF